jgi:Ras GTPase-activating-like protein IQGAP2/3
MEPYPTATSPTQSQKGRPVSFALSRSESVRTGTDGPGRLSHSHFNPHLDKPELQQFQRSSTSHLRALSRYAQDGDNEDFTIKSKEQEVTGLHGRRRLQRGDSVRTKKAVTGWAGRTWMDQQRQFLQAYEYLCHIGEAKEWIEDIVQKPIPPIVQLEEALRDGIILAEVVQALFPERRLRIFRGPGLTFRHSENIAIFFRLLEEVDLPDLFWFELVDLYEKKNIPKIIYCIHSLSWILWRKGMTDFRIGNLVGQLQFEDHELEAAQKGLDRAGISLPNFSGMGASFGAEPEPEPVETEEERIDRELSEHADMVADLQAQMRGALLRIRLGDVMQNLWDSEDWVVELQSRIRGDFSREIFRYRLDMKNFAVNLQSAVRGFLARRRTQDVEWYWSRQEPQLIQLQSLLRAFVARDRVQTVKATTQRHDNGIRQLQAAIRGAFARRDVADEHDATREMEPMAMDMQSAVRGFIVRQHLQNQRRQIMMEEKSILELQSLARGLLERRVIDAVLTDLEDQTSIITQLQAAARAHMLRNKTSGLRTGLEKHSAEWTNLQSLARAFIVQQSIQAVQQELLENEKSIIALQNMAMGFLVRHRMSNLRKSLADQQSSIVALQSAARGSIQRTRVFDLLCSLNEHESSITTLQALARAVLYRSDLDQFLMDLEETEDSIIALQSLARGSLVRVDFAEKMRHYKENMQKVIKIQSFIRARQQGEAYKVLTTGKNPPVGTVKNFVHLLNDSDFDFDEEIEFERLRKTIGQRIREIEHLEQYVDQLDIKIALLVKNKITLDEIIRHQKHFGGYVGDLLSNKSISSKDPFDLKALNKNSRKKLEHYQALFFLLQTQPQYLARLLKKLRTKGLPEPESKKIELLTMGIFGFAQKGREEFYLLKLISKSTKEDLDSCQNWVEYLRGNQFWTRLFSNYLKSPRDRKYLRELLGPVVRQDIIENTQLDLESDPMQIYLSVIKNEELQTGRRSQRPTDISREEAIKDPQTRKIFIRHLQDLRDIADDFFVALEETVEKMPYGIRYIAKETYHLLCEKFSQEHPDDLFNNVAVWMFKMYIQPALLQPDTWSVVDNGLTPMQKRNLGEVAKVIGQVVSGRLFGGDNVYLQPINSYISENMGRVHEIWGKRKFLTTAELQLTR